MTEDAAEQELLLTDALCSAAWADRVGELKALISNGAKVNALGLNGMPPLYSAIENGSIDSVQLLLEAGARSDSYANADGWLPIGHAIEVISDAYSNNVDRNPCFDIVWLLLDYGADLEVSGPPLDRSAVEYASAMFGHEHMERLGVGLLKVFIEYARDLNQVAS